MDANIFFACFLSSLPGPPGVTIQDAYFQLLPINKVKCPRIDTIRDISYQLYTNYNPLVADNLRIGDDMALHNSHFNFSDPTVIYFHGFFESAQGPSSTLIRTAYLHKGGHNILLVNAQRLQAGAWYLTGVKNVQVIGHYTAMFIDYLVSKGLPMANIHLVGFSNGAQMAGVAAANVKSGRIPRITGLDPAKPLFTLLPNSMKLDKSDADFVDVIHTDAGGFGYPTSIGHVDFWPNRGTRDQPGCTAAEVKKRNPDGFIEIIFCSHWRAFQYYAESVINSNGFLAVQSKNWNTFLNNNYNSYQVPINMGNGLAFYATGNYYLRTNAQSPFSLM